ncbi:MAG: (4Fe-4S)-binding protein [Firmicutes bacterium]|nr:(4Fe-4S)-binding protein [Bacillota bacterium]
MSKKMVLVDTSKCTGCKACTVACKEWNELPAEKTQLLTSYQTMKEFTPKTWTYTTFTEKYEYPKMNWYIRKAQCFHCAEPACLKSCSSNAISKTDSGYVVIEQELCIGCGYCVDNCPFGVPKLDNSRKKAYKCTGCIDRVENNLTPACVQTCQPGCLEYGERETLLPQAKKRLSEVQKTHPKARIYGETEMGGTTFVYLLLDAPEVYGLPINPTTPLSLTIWKDIVRPVGGIAVGGAAAAVFVGVFGNVLRGAYREQAQEEKDAQKGGKR